MQKIKQLAEHEAHKIAAGEVVERPANIVKELVENAIDAGATKISIYITNGGHTQIQVVDNGYGMSPEDAKLCFAKHATSKITSVDQLHEISTFGFRGEALASICAVSKVILQTKENDAEQGIKLIRHNHTFIDEKFITCTNGTDITVSDLFYNVPARKKFLKKEETDWRTIVQLFQSFCLDYLNIHFQLYADGKLIHNCPTMHDLKNRMIQLFDASLEHHLISLAPTKTGDCTIKGIVSDTQLWRYNRNQIFIFVNKRWIKNYELGRAIIKAYAASLPKDRYPIAALFITLDPHAVDINIHPRKEEVQFLHPRKIETALYEAINSALQNHISAGIIQSSGQIIPMKSDAPVTTSPSSTLFTSIAPQPFKTTHQAIAQSPISEKKSLVQKPAYAQQAIEQPIQHTQAQQNEYTILGVAHKTYILLEHTDGIFIVDQHAAHERVLYELFCKRFKTLPTIRLMFPELLQFKSEDLDILEQYQQLFLDHGIEFNRMGSHELTITATPIHLKSVAFKPFLQDCIEEIKELSDLDQSAFFDALHKKLRAQMACKAAVKAGDHLTNEQIKQLLHDLDQTENRLTCPHGRPTGWLLSKYELEKKFKRIV